MFCNENIKMFCTKSYKVHIMDDLDVDRTCLPTEKINSVGRGNISCREQSRTLPSRLTLYKILNGKERKL